MKRFSIYFSFFLFLSLTNCSYNMGEVVPPNNLIPKDTFTMILHDMMVLENYYAVVNDQKKVPKSEYFKAADEILKAYNIDSIRYVNSSEYYFKKQEEFIEIYNAIQDSLTLESVNY